MASGSIALAVVGCGGGSSGVGLSVSQTNLATPDAGAAATPSVQALQVATFVDAPVAGLEFQGDGYSGITDEQGRFHYRTGDRVSFRLGNVVLGSAVPAGDTVTPLDLAPGAIDARDTRVVRMLRTLQTLDDDANPDNGIHITAATRQQLRQPGEIDLSHDETTDMAVESRLPERIYRRTEEDAVAHFERWQSKGETGAATPKESATEADDTPHSEAEHDTDETGSDTSSPDDTPTGSEPTRSIPTTTVSQPASSAGRLLASNCFQCHGTGGMGGFERIRGGEAAEVFEYLTKPASSDIMAAHAQGYTRAQLQAIVDYLRR
jgi:hypothetical protein